MNHSAAVLAPSPRTGRFAVPFSLLRGRGSGAPAARRPLLAALALAVTALLALAVSPALAAPPAQFGSQGEGTGQIGAGAQGIAVDQASGDVFVNDGTDNLRADRFSSEGAFQLSFGWGVADGSAELQSCGPVAAPPAPLCRQGIVGFNEPPNLLPAGPGQFGVGPAGIAVDATTHDIYVHDSPNRITKFGPNGEFLFMLGGGVDQGGGTPSNPGNICTAAFLANGDTCSEATPGSGAGEFETLGGAPLAVGPGGTLYVGDNERIEKFSPAGAFEGQIPLPGVIAQKIAADSAGDIYVASGSFGGVRKYDPSGTELGSPRDPLLFYQNSAIAIGPSDRLLVDDTGTQQLSVYDPAGAQLLSVASAATSPQGITYSPATERVYELGSGVVYLHALPPSGTPYVVPPGEDAAEIGTTTATVKVTANPEGGEETTYAVQYVDQHSFETEGGFASPNTQVSTPIELTGGPFEDQPVSVQLSGLLPHTTYHYRVVLTNKAAQSTLGAGRTLETLPPVSIDATSVTEVNATTALLETELNPHGLPTTYHFEYDTVPYAEGEAGHGESTPTDSAGFGSADTLRAKEIQGLVPLTTYHFRVLAENSLGTVIGSDRAFTTQPAFASTALPDSRAYELVSPPDKHGASLSAQTNFGGVIQAAADGSGLAYIASTAPGEEAAGNRSSNPSQLLSVRSASGLWSTQNITAPHRAPAGVIAGKPSEYQLFSADLSRAALEPFGATPLSPLVDQYDLYLRGPAGDFQPLLVACPEESQPCPPQIEAAANVPPGTPFGGEERLLEAFNNPPFFVTGNADLSSLLFTSFQALTPDFSPGFEPTGDNVYEWHAGAIRLASLIPPGAATVCGGPNPPCLPSTELGQRAAVGRGDFQVRHAISTDGSRVVFETAPESSHSPHLYLRDLDSGQTVALDAPEGCPEPTCEAGAAQYQDASADGSRVFFTDERRLTADSTAAPGRADLYMCEVEEEESGQLACKLTDLSVNPIDPFEPAGVLGTIAGASQDGSVAYFVANGALTAGAVRGDCTTGLQPSSNQCNLYRVDTQSGAIRLIAVLSDADFPDWNAGGGRDLGELTARVSPNGRYLAFMSSRSVTGYDNRDARTGARDQEVFLYDAIAERLLCPSCNPTGARPHGVFDNGVSPGLLVDRPLFWRGQTLAANLPGWTHVDVGHALYQSRYLSNFGRLFFNAADALAPRDTNGTFDVYQFEFPAGTGQPESNICTTASSAYSPASGGCVSLISSGTSSEESAFLDASESGDDVFFLTASRLTGKDVDAALDIYDARSGGGEPEQVKPVECSGDACQQPATPPNDVTPGSLTFNGPGNLKECPKGKRLREGKCVKQKAKKKKHHQQHKKNSKKSTKRTGSNHGGHR